MKKLNWSCTICGMSSSRKYSVRRHIENYNIHNGSGKVVSFVEYSIGRREGYYHAEPVTTQSLFLDKILDKIATELENLIAKDIAKKIYEELSSDQWPFDILKTLAKTSILRKNYYKTLKNLTS